jgi:glutathione synthase/RimK-type ligase-like ATP-grasp enzyme
MKKILILRTLGEKTRDSNKDWNELADGLGRLLPNVEINTAALTDLIFDANGAESRIYHYQDKWDLADFDLVLIRRVGDEIELGIAVAQYLELKDVPYTDKYLFTQGKGKLAGSFLRARISLPAPRTVSGTPETLIDLFRQEPPFDFPFILKADLGSKGRDNYLVQSIEELQEVLQSATINYVAQPFIYNDGDYRLLVFNGQLALVIRRIGKEGSHLNNTSQGGHASIVEAKSMSQSIVQDALRAAESEELAVAGVDIIIDKKDGKHYILEVNRAPQLTTGSFPEEKLQEYAHMVEGMIK